LIYVDVEAQKSGTSLTGSQQYILLIGHSAVRQELPTTEDSVHEDVIIPDGINNAITA